jgi:hypothetical protein
MLTGAMWLLEGRLEVFCYCGTVGWLRRGRFVWADMWRPVPLGMWMMAWIGHLWGCMVRIGAMSDGGCGMSWRV